MRNVWCSVVKKLEKNKSWLDNTWVVPKAILFTNTQQAKIIVYSNLYNKQWTTGRAAKMAHLPIKNKPGQAKAYTNE